jgi:hypothetical protein
MQCSRIHLYLTTYVVTENKSDYKYGDTNTKRNFEFYILFLVCVMNFRYNKNMSSHVCIQM